MAATANKPLDPFRGSGERHFLPPEYLVSRTHPESIGKVNLMFRGEPIYASTNTRYAGGPLTNADSADVIMDAFAASANTPVPDIIDETHVSQTNAPPPEPDIPAAEPIAPNNAGDAFSDVSQPAFAVPPAPQPFAAQPFGDLDDIPADPPSGGLFGRLFNRRRTGTLRPAASGRARHILTIILRLARIVVPIMVVFGIISAVANNWSAISGILVLFATVFFISVLAITLLARHHLDHRAVFAISAVIGIFAVLIKNNAMLYENFQAIAFTVTRLIALILILVISIALIIPRRR